MNDNINRRTILASSAAMAAGAVLKTSAARAVTNQALATEGRSYGGRDKSISRAKALWSKPLPPGLPHRDYLPVVVPNAGTLPFKIVDGVKVFHMVAMELWNEFVPGLKALVWGYNGMLNPVLEAVEGERVRIYVTNRLPEKTTVHWHGVYVDNGMDGVGGLTQKPILPGETYKYEFNLVEPGTKMYHPHYDEMTQIALGMTGMFVIHPRKPRYRVDRDFAIMLHEWSIVPGTYRPNPLEMTDFNVFTMNGKSFPSTHPLVARTGQRVRIRLGNLGPMDHHPIHLHNYSFQVVGSDGGDYPPSAWQPETTVLVPVGSTRVVEFDATNPGDWAMHCHMTHHMMTQMGHHFGNMIGVKPGNLGHKMRQLLPQYMTMGQDGMGSPMGIPTMANTAPMEGGKGPYGFIDMGGMFTIVKIRDHITNYDDVGWYAPEAPKGTVAEPAEKRDLHRDGINPETIPAPIPGPSSPAAPPM